MISLKTSFFINSLSNNVKGDKSQNKIAFNH